MASSIDRAMRGERKEALGAKCAWGVEGRVSGGKDTKEKGAQG